MMLDDDTVFKKLILVQNDYTYRELDYEYGRAIVSDSVGLEEGYAGQGTKAQNHLSQKSRRKYHKGSY